MSSPPKDIVLRVDENDLIQRRWSCKNYPCLHKNRSKCDLIFLTSIKYRVHIRQFHQNPRFPNAFQCPVISCKDYNKTFSRFQYLRNHYDSIHRVTKDYICCVCKKGFSCKKTFTRHEKDCKSPFLKCDFCDSSYSSHSSLSRHVHKHHPSELRKIHAGHSKGANVPLEGLLKGSSTKFLLIPIEKYISLTNKEGTLPGAVPVTPVSDTHNEAIDHSSLTQSFQYLNKPTQNTSSVQSPSSSKRHKVSESTWTSPSLHNQHPVQIKITNSHRSNDSLQTTRSVEWSERCANEKEEDWRSQEPVLRKPSVYDIPPSGYENQVLHDKPLFSALDNITTQTDNFWSLNELSTQTITEQQSFGTQTAQMEDDFVSSILDCDFVEYLDGAVQTEHENPKTDSSSFAAQTSISTESFGNDRSCGVDRLDRDCQTYYFTSSTHTQTNMVRERALVVADGLNSQTQTTQESFPQSFHESFTQTIDEMSPGI